MGTHPRGNVWPPGISQNPGGRPQSRHLTEAAHKIRAMAPAERKKFRKAKDLTTGDEMILACMEAAVGGDIRALTELWDRLEGKVPQRVEGELSLSSVLHSAADRARDLAAGDEPADAAGA